MRRDVWIETAVSLYDSLGETRAIKTLYDMERGACLVKDLKEEGDISYTCPVCGKKHYGERQSFCDNCGAHLIYDMSESIFAVTDDWRSPGRVPGEDTDTFLLCNVFGDKYLAAYDYESMQFEAGEPCSEEIVLAYTPVEDEHDKEVLGKLCTRHRCLACSHLGTEDGLPCCPYEDACGAFRFRDLLPRYKLPNFAAQV